MGWCGGTYSHIFKTTNGGYNWYEQAVPIDGFRKSFWLCNDSIGWVVGGGGYVLHTTNGGTYVDLQQISTELPRSFALFQNYPNPFNIETEIEFDIVKSEIYKMEIYDLLGRKITEAFDKYLIAGKYRIKYNASQLSTGVYFYKLSNYNSSLAKKLILIK